jgi:hypothetical protein
MKVAPDVLGDDDFVQECASPASGVLLLACTVGDDDDDPASRVVLIRDGGWFDFKVSGDAFVSIDAHEDGRAFVLGESGTVAQFDWRAPTQAQLKASCRILENNEADSFGPLRRLRIVGEDVFTVGTSGQVYRLRDDIFERLPQLVLDGNELSVKDASGTGYGDLVVVTTDGFAAHFDGSDWRIPTLPTNAGLSSITRLPDGRYAIAGYNSAVLIGLHNQWQVLAPNPDYRNYYGVATASGEIFVAYLGGVDRVDGTALQPVPLPTPPPKLEFAFIRSGPDGVWAASGHTVGRVTPTGWLPI